MQNKTVCYTAIIRGKNVACSIVQLSKVQHLDFASFVASFKSIKISCRLGGT